jgi:hypothetical protein
VGEETHGGHISIDICSLGSACIGGLRHKGKKDGWRGVEAFQDCFTLCPLSIQDLENVTSIWMIHELSSATDPFVEIQTTRRHQTRGTNRKTKTDGGEAMQAAEPRSHRGKGGKIFH